MSSLVSVPFRLGAIALATATILIGSPAVAEENFRLLPGSVMQDDDNGFEGKQGYARGLGYEVIQGYAVAEGDMVLGKIDSYGRLSVPFQSRGLGQRSLFNRWPDGIVPFSFHPGVSEVQQANIEEAIERLNTKTRILLVPADSEQAEGYADYILFEPSGGCASFVGRQLREDKQSVWVADSCSVGSIVHEIAHAIGLFHEHTRPDRDNHITVAWDEIIEDKTFNFEIYDEGAESWGTYDYGSIMHYGEYYFSGSGERTIIAPPNVEIGQRIELSDADIESIDRMYATDLAADANVFVSDRGLEVDVSIANLGDLGARDLTLRVVGDVGTDWLSVSADSGWDCLAYNEELRCERGRLIEQANSRFTLVADPETTGVEAIGLRVDSVTLDINAENNKTGAEILDDEPEEEAGQLQIEPPGVPAAALPSEPEPEPSNSPGDENANSMESEQTAAPATPTSRSNPGLGAASGGGGATTGLTLAMLGLAAYRRRRNSPR